MSWLIIRCHPGALHHHLHFLSFVSLLWLSLSFSLCLLCSLPLPHLSPLCLRPALKCDAVSCRKQSSVTVACNSHAVAILAWTLTVVAVTSYGEGDTDQVDEKEDRCSGLSSDCTFTTSLNSHGDTTHRYEHALSLPDLYFARTHEHT